MINIELCKIDELPKLLDFINENWKQNHILSKNKKLLDWQHLNITENIYNFLIAKEIETGKILGILGFISTGQYDSNLLQNGDYYGAIWKIDYSNQLAIGLGHSLFKKFQKLPYFQNFGAIGISNDTKNYMKIINYRVEKLNQYYILNCSISSFNIAVINTHKPIIDVLESDCSLIKINDLVYFQLDSFYKPEKSIQFLINKYQNHPIYHYSFYGVLKNKELVVIFVLRKINLLNSSCLRIVDCLGDLSSINSLYADFQTLLNEENSEYVDFFNYGIHSSVFHTMGFQMLSEDDVTIIPNYFEPFEQRNVTLECAFNSKHPNYVFFKGDSDQDRPNL